MIVSAQVVLASRDCAWPGCVRDAAGTRRFCKAHQAPTEAEDARVLARLVKPRCQDCSARVVPRRGDLCRPCTTLKHLNSVRELELRCRACEAWLPDEAFSFETPRTEYRRGRKATCRVCRQARRVEIAALRYRR